MFNMFKKKIFSKKYLHKKSAQKHKKDWEKFLQKLGEVANVNAEKGDNSLRFQWSAVKISHNHTRPHKDIIKDIENKFIGCKIEFDSDLNGQTFCKISWNNT